MSCPDCEAAQSEGRKTYYRIGNGNVEVCGCEKHLREMFTKLRGDGLDRVVVRPNR